MLQTKFRALLDYGLTKGLIKENEKQKTFYRLVSLFGTNEAYSDYKSKNKVLELEPLLVDLVNYAIKHEIITNNQKDYFETEIMNVFSWSETKVVQRFKKDYTLSPSVALDDFYKYCCDINYVKLAAIKKNKHFNYQDDDIKLEITINLSKPEKDPKAIAFAKNQKSKIGPKCDLCLENVEYTNHLDKNKQTLRIIPLELNKQPFFFQFSPYSYFYQHSIVVKNIHTPLKITNKTIKELIAFVDQFPTYIIGSNADLPIVGGSILSHNHYQCGLHSFPLEQAKSLTTIKYSNTSVSLLNWPLSTLKIEGNDSKSIVKVVNLIMKAWESYQNKDLGIKNSKQDRHNSVNPIVRKLNNAYIVYLMLRNNYTNKAYPDGVFHVHPEHFHIKKENIGLIEALGLAILPPRLDKELKEVKKALKNPTKVNMSDLGIQQNWYLQLKTKYQGDVSLDSFLKQEVGSEFKQCLENCGVFYNHSKDFIEFVGGVFKCMK